MNADEPEVDMMDVASYGTDAEWWDASNGHCGRCGDLSCHRGLRCDDGPDGECQVCPERQP